MRLVFLGEQVRYKARAQEGGIGGSTDRWSTGTWLGVDGKANQYILFDEEHGVRMARTITRLPEPDRFCSEKVAAVSATPFTMKRPSEPCEPVVTFEHRPDLAPQEDAAPPRSARRLYIRQADLERFGHTVGCPRCDHALRYGPNRTSAAHSTARRARILERLRESEHAGAARHEGSC